MLDLQPVFEFSRLNCVTICAFLVPANLIATITTLGLVATGQSLSKIRWSKTIASWLAITLFLHVSTWFVIGVITPVTFILFGLGTTCLMTNVMAVAYRQEIAQLFSVKLLPPLT
ncbi:MAG: hypothetical protein ACFCU7_01795 [Pleurocapsa sp.]